MEITIYLAQLWGPVLLLLGLGILFNRDYYRKVYSDLEENALALMMFGVSAIALGLAQILAHNSWQNLAEILISLLGWSTLFKGAVMLIVPKQIDKMVNCFLKKKLLLFVEIALIIVGLYLIFIGYWG